MRRGPALLATIGWGLFCACSWTWVIGMFLPKILLERYGWPGFLAFAVPNVLGCAAFGFVMRTPARAERLGRDHAVASTWFSLVTIAYHLFFGAWLVLELLPADLGAVGPIDGDPGRTLLLAAGGMAIAFGGGWILAQLDDRGWLIAAALIYAISISALAILAGQPSTLGALEPLRPARDLPPLVPVIAFGFLLCPYLDRTFMRALSRSGDAGSFAVFGIAFAAMLATTLVLWFRPLPLLVPVALAHLTLQGIFTVGAHLREVACSPLGRAPGARARLLAIAWLPGLLFAALRGLDVGAIDGEAWYLRFLAAYGLLFPLYVLLFVGPQRPIPAGPAARRGFLVALLLAAPCYEAAFIHDRPWWLLAPIAGLGAWIVRRARD